MLSDVDDEEEEPPPLSAVVRALKGLLTPAVPSATSFWDPSFAGALVLSAGAARLLLLWWPNHQRVRRRRITSSFSSLSLPNLWTG